MNVRLNQFVRGNTFSHTFEIPASSADGVLAGWFPVSQVRKVGNSQPMGFIADLECKWVDIETTRHLTVTSKDTDKWPVGPFELDLLLLSPHRESIRLPKVMWECVAGVSKVSQ